MHPDMLSEINERLRLLSRMGETAGRAISEASRKDAARLKRVAWPEIEAARGKGDPRAGHDEGEE